MSALIEFPVAGRSAVRRVTADNKGPRSVGTAPGSTGYLSVLTIDETPTKAQVLAALESFTDAELSEIASAANVISYERSLQPSLFDDAAWVAA